MTIELHNNVYCEGEGIPVVLVHGFPVDHRMWNECADALKTTVAKHGMKQFPIWAPDMPGAGEGPIPSDENSGGKDTDGAFPNGLDRMADAYVDLLHAAGYDKAIWVGLSMGGYLILDVQRLHPEAVAALANRRAHTNRLWDSPLPRLRIQPSNSRTPTANSSLHGSTSSRPNVSLGVNAWQPGART